MSKAYFFAIFLLAASFTGCIGDEDLDLTEAEEETTEEDIDPVGSEDETGAPGVEFLGIIEDYGYFYLVAATYDSNGYIKSYSLETTGEEEFFDYECGIGMEITENTTFTAEYDCYPIYHSSIFVDICYDIEHVNQTITAKVEDNDGNLASDEYVLTEEDFTACEDYYRSAVPIATFFVEESSAGMFYVEVIKVSVQASLEDFSYFLKGETGSTYVGGNGFGEVAMQMIGGEEYGIDVSYSGDDEQLQSRTNNISADDGTYYPVHFSDNDRDGMLSAGDQFTVYGQGNSANGPAEDGWKLDIKFDPTSDIVGSATLM